MMATTETRFTSSGLPLAIRATKHAGDAQKLWWEHMLELGWNRSYYDLASYIAATKSRGFLLAYPEKSLDPSGHVMAVVYDNDTAWIALFVTSANVRGQGYGAPLFQSALEDLTAHDVRYCGLDAVEEQVATYTRRGFVEASNGIIRCMIRPFGLPPPDIKLSPELVARDITEDDLDALIESDRAVSGFERRGLWTAQYLKRHDVKGVVIIESSQRQVPIAWAMVRNCPGGARIGPVYARDAVLAKAILAKSLELATPEFVKHCPLPGVDLAHRNSDEIRDRATTIAEVSLANPKSLAVFEAVGFVNTGVDFHRMWLNDRVPPEQSAGGTAEAQMFAIYDAATG